MRILGIDYGDARIGLAICDESETLASPIGTYVSKTMRQDIDHLARLARDMGAEKIVLGLPLNMDGSAGPRADKTQTFGTVLQRVSGIEVVYEDERLTTVEAEEKLIACGMRREKRQKIIDTVSAQIILQSYLDAQRRKRERK